MVIAARLISSSLLLLITGYWLLVSPTQAAPQPCTIGQTCTIGEFLYDDTYTPDASASCTLNVTTPSGSTLYANQTMTSRGDGWYSFNLVTATASAGLYPSRICCTPVGSDQLCLDKSFELNPAPSTLSSTDIQSAVWDASSSAFNQSGTFGNFLQNIQSLTAADVWSYSSRNLTGFGTLVADVWGYSTRSLTTFGSLVSNIWSNDKRTLTESPTDISNLASKTEVNNQTAVLKEAVVAQIKATKVNYADSDLVREIARQVAENRDLLDVLVNEPIVKSFIEDGEAPDLSQKLNQTKNVVNSLYAAVQQAQSRAGLLDLKLDTLPRSEAAEELKSLENLIGAANPTDQKADTLTANLEWFNKAWGGDLPTNLASSAQQARTALNSARVSLEAGDKNDAALTLKLALKSLKELENGVGDVTNNASDRTLYGKLKEVQALSAALDTNEQAIGGLMASWNTLNQTDKQQQIATVKRDVLKANRLPKANDILDSADSKPENKDKNQALGLMAVTTLNRLLLAKMAGEPLKGLWLEEGSVVFKILVTNPSDRMEQTVPVDYVLPREVKKEDIIVAPPGLTLEYNPDAAALTAKGEFKLIPGETKTFAIEVTDIWTIPQQEISSLRNQASELMKPLEKTSFFGQGATIKSDIDVTLDKIEAGSRENVTPEARIKAYREAQIELAGVKNQIQKLQDLVTQAGNSGSIFGFIGGVQAVAVWGIIIIFIAGFVFLTLYMRTLRSHEIRAQAGSAASTGKPSAMTLPIFNPAKALKGTPLPRSPRRFLDNSRLAISVAISPENARATRMFLLVVGVMSSAILIIIILTSIFKPQPPQVISPAGNPANPDQSSLSGLDAPASDPGSKATPDPGSNLTAAVSPPSDGTPVKLREKPSTSGKIIKEISSPLPVKVIGTEGAWSQVQLDDNGIPLSGYIHTNYIKSSN